MIRTIRIACLLLAGVLVACGQESNAPVETTSNPAEQTDMTQTGSAELGDWGVDLSNRDLSVRPGDDFARYANGSWVDRFEIPADRSRYGAFDILRKISDERVNAIIEDLVNSEPLPGTMEQKVADYYRSFMDVETINRLGIEPLRPALAAIGQIDSMADLVTAFGRAQLDTTASPLGFGISADRADPDRHQLSVAIGGISLPDRDYYLLDDERFIIIRNAYREHIIRMLDFAGFEGTDLMADSVIKIETQIAAAMWPRDQRRNRDLTYNPMTYADFKQAWPGINWDSYFAAAGVEGLEDLNVTFPSAMDPVIDVINSTSLDAWQAYLSYQLIANNSGILAEEIDQAGFDFYSTVLNGIPQQRERWERAVMRVGGLDSLGLALGQIYVERHFPPSAKRQMEDLVENLRSALRQSIEQNDWMDAPTKKEALLKISAFRPKIAYPDVWKDLSAIEIVPGDVFANARNVRDFFYWDNIGDLHEATDREEWGMTPQTVNAYYNSSFNEIVFPAGILQPPFFDPNADMAVNYGAIGVVIGHEMGHGFDDQGSKSDYRGIQRNWWTEEVRAAFDQMTGRLADQYAQFEPLAGNFIDGRFTLGENIGDVGGLSMAYQAYQIALNGQEAPVIDGLTGDQRFFLGYAQVWLGKIREEALVSQLKSDPHSPAEFRIQGAVRNHDAWYKAFDVQPTDALYLPPEERVRIW